MSYFIGIDLGTTNSAICVYDGTETRILKSTEQNDVTPSVIYFDRRGRKQIGQGAYDLEPIYPNSCANLFKRRMGEDHKIELSAVNRTVAPEECSADILKELFSSLPEEIRKSPVTGTVVTVPAAFNQKARNATREAAEMAGIGKVELMQEPVASVMSFMHRVSETDGIFLIYDLGGGTFDVAIAQSIGRKVAILAHGGIEMCGGRDFDRHISHNIVLPRLYEEYDLPDDLFNNESFKRFLRIVEYSIEQPKKALSRQEEATIVIPIRDDWSDYLQDLNGKTAFKEVPLQRDTFDKIIAEKINDTINCSRKTMEECSVNAHDINRIVWVGGPTHYKPLRDKVSSELGINGEISNLNPMTAVAEGASLFAESIDWSSDDYQMKPTRGQISADELGLSFNYTARTPSDTSKIAVQVKGQVPVGFEFQIDSLDTGTTSGRLPLKHATTVDVSLAKPGENTFKVVVYDAVGEPISIEQDRIVITKTAALVEAIPAPSSIYLKVLDKPGGRHVLIPLIRKGEHLPKNDSVEGLKAGNVLEAGSLDSLNFILLEGEFQEDIDANQPIGSFEIKGIAFDEGVIPEGADLICKYEIKNSAEIKLMVEVPDIRGIFESSESDFYSPEEGKIDYTSNAWAVVEGGIAVRNSINEIKEVVDDPKLDQALQKLETALSLDSDESDPEKVKEAEQCISQAKELLEEVSIKNRSEICQIKLDGELSFFDMYCRQHARPSEERAFDNLVATTQRSIDNNDRDFDDHLNELNVRIFEILWRQPWFIIERFKNLIRTPHIFTNKFHFDELAMKGKQLVGSDLIRRYEELSPAEKYQTAIIDDGTIEELREIVREMMSIPRIRGDEVADRDNVVNIFKS